MALSSPSAALRAQGVQASRYTARGG